MLIIFSCNKDEPDKDIELVSCFSYTPTNIKIGDEITFLNCSENATSYYWSFGDNSSSSDFEPTHIYNHSGYYTVRLAVTSSDNLTKTKSGVLHVSDTCKLNMSEYDVSFGIKYDSTENYLTPGDISDLSESNLNEIIAAIGTPEYSINGIKSVFNWFNATFTFQNAGGNMIGKKTIDELYESKVFYGCHSASLILSSVLREFGFPAVMIETADVQWAYDYSAGTAQYFKGHVMSEIYVNNEWILLDINGKYMDNYDYLNPYIKMPNYSCLFVYTKGKDIWDYGVFDESDTHNFMIIFSDNIICYEPMFSSNNYQWKNL